MKFIHILCVSSTLLLAACGSDSNSTGGAAGSNNTNNNNNTGDDAGGGDAGNNTNATPSSVSVAITAAEGGDVALEDGAGVSIPAGALSDDTAITIESSEPTRLPDLSTIQGLAYDFGPNGTTFDVPVELTLPLTATPGANEEAVVSWLDEATDTWQDVVTTVNGDTVVAEVEHFTMFVVRFRGVAVDAFTCDFDETCAGGDLVGAWTIQGGCVDIPNPFEGFCATATFDVESTMEGSVTFNANGTYSSSVTSGGTFHVVVPSTCLQGAQGTCVEALGSDSSDGGSTWTCTGTPAEGCDCTVTGDSKVEEDMGTYTAEGNQLTMTGADEVANVITYCVTGDNFKAKQIEQKDGDAGAPTTIVWSATR